MERTFDAVGAWHTEHVYFSRLLDLLQEQVDVFHANGRPDYELMLDVVSYLREYSDRFHHPREDVAFARLVKHCPEMELPLARLVQEHRVIAHAGDTLLNQFNAVLGGEVVPRAAIETAAATYLVYYRAHLASEEADVLTRAAQVLTPEDWKAVKEAVPAGRDPLFGDRPRERYRELRRRVAFEARPRASAPSARVTRLHDGRPRRSR